jgi:hypothetical protein
MDNAARTRQRLLAIFLPVTAVLYIGGQALSPKGTGQTITNTASQPQPEPAVVPG